jgi:flagellar basal body rod protein FlgC
VGLLNTIGIGRRAVGAASAGIDVTSQNVANARSFWTPLKRLTMQNLMHRLVRIRRKKKPKN